jgi:hypothetical protein
MTGAPDTRKRTLNQFPSPPFSCASTAARAWIELIVPAPVATTSVCSSLEICAPVPL